MYLQKEIHLNVYLGLRLQVADLVDEPLFTACICIMNVLCVFITGIMAGICGRGFPKQ